MIAEKRKLFVSFLSMHKHSSRAYCFPQGVSASNGCHCAVMVAVEVHMGVTCHMAISGIECQLGLDLVNWLQHVFCLLMCCLNNNAVIAYNACFNQ